MDSNTHSTDQPSQESTRHPAKPPPGRPDWLSALAMVADGLAAQAQDLDGLPDAVLAEQVLGLRRLVDRLDGQWLQLLAAVDARGAAGADQGIQAASTASWLRNRLRMGANAATSSVRTARAVFRGRLTATAAALTAGDISPAHATVLAAGAHHLPHPTAAKAEPTLLAAARSLDPPRLRRVLGHLQQTLDPDGAADQAERQHAQRWLRVAATFEGMVAIDGQLDPEAGAIVQAALDPLARPASADDERTGGQRKADALTELARRQLEGGQLPQTGGVRPQLTVTVDLDSLIGHPGAVGGELGQLGSLVPEGCRRLACDGAVTRLLVSRHPTDQHHPSRLPGLAGWLESAMAKLPPTLGSAPSQPLDVGRTSRVVTPAQRSALAVRDGGCIFPHCDRPLYWTEAHHLRHWLHGGPTDLANLVLLCRSHHRAVHEGGWRLERGPDGRWTAHPPHRRHRAVA